MALLLREVLRVVTVQSEHLLYKKANDPGAAQVGFEEALGVGSLVCQTTETTAMSIKTRL